MANRTELKTVSRDLRKKILQMILCAGGGHIGPSFSIAEILTVLYHGDILRYHIDDPNWVDRDRFILSKGHASAAVFAVLAQVGIISAVELDSYCQPGSRLGGHPDMLKVPGIEASTGALGHGLSYGVGVAMVGKMDDRPWNVYVLIGDGECQEGSIWEAALFAPQRRLDNLTVIIDYNKLQAMDRLDEIVSLEPMADKWRSFGWDVCEIDGHDIVAIHEALRIEQNKGKPRIIIAHTIKGKGVSYMENEPLWHYRLPNEEERKLAISELDNRN